MSDSLQDMLSNSSTISHPFQLVRYSVLHWMIFTNKGTNYFPSGLIQSTKHSGYTVSVLCSMRYNFGAKEDVDEQRDAYVY